MIDEKWHEEITQTVKSAKGLRELLFNELDNFLAGKISEKQARIVSRLAINILDTVRVEMDAFRHPLSVEFAKLPDSPKLEV